MRKVEMSMVIGKVVRQGVETIPGRARVAACILVAGMAAALVGCPNVGNTLNVHVSGASMLRVSGPVNTVVTATWFDSNGEKLDEGSLEIEEDGIDFAVPDGADEVMIVAGATIAAMPVDGNGVPLPEAVDPALGRDSVSDDELAEKAFGTGPVNAYMPLGASYQRISRSYGYVVKKTNPATGQVETTYHSGIDLPAPPGTSVKAPCDMYIKVNRTTDAYLAKYPKRHDKVWNSVLVGYSPGLQGQCRVGAPRYFYFGHIVSSLGVNACQFVRAGQVIGTIRDWYDEGANNSDVLNNANAHLHFGMSTKQIDNLWGYPTSLADFVNPLTEMKFVM